MMARWSLDALLEDLPEIDADVLFLTGGMDTAVPPDVAKRAAKRLPNATVHQFEDLGHLAHEEDPERILAEIRAFLYSAAASRAPWSMARLASNSAATSAPPIT